MWSKNSGSTSALPVLAYNRNSGNDAYKDGSFILGGAWKSTGTGFGTITRPFGMVRNFSIGGGAQLQMW